MWSAFAQSVVAKKIPDAPRAMVSREAGVGLGDRA
jgi:hypothetical protein